MHKTIITIHTKLLGIQHGDGRYLFFLVMLATYMIWRGWFKCQVSFKIFLHLVLQIDSRVYQLCKDWDLKVNFLKESGVVMVVKRKRLSWVSLNDHSCLKTINWENTYKFNNRFWIFWFDTVKVSKEVHVWIRYKYEHNHDFYKRISKAFFEILT